MQLEEDLHSDSFYNLLCHVWVVHHCLGRGPGRELSAFPFPTEGQFLMVLALQMSPAKKMCVASS